jgi:DNA topoisomerase I
MNLLIVESPAKAKTINKYLGSSYKVLASFGHVRDLPAKDGSVEPDNNFEMHWIQDDERSKKVMREIVDAAKGCDKIILATDPDREGEAISWHLLELLKQKKAITKGMAVERVTFNAITKQSVQDALKKPREIDDPLVSAYLARRALDYLVGFNLSPVLWRKLPGARSAGRVQSVALRIVCEREAEIEAFKTEEYWSIEAQMLTAKQEEFAARLTAIDGTTLKKLDLKDGISAEAIKAAIEKGAFKVVSVDKKPVKRNPYPPFMTSTLQMDASRRLGFSAKQTMGVAQRLYEGADIGGETVGLITYMRTDGVDITPEGIAQIRKVVQEDFSNRYLPPFIREYKTKAKNAQEAHEAIRPTDPARRPQDIKKYLDKDQFALYDLIWKRAVASQMASAEMEATVAEITVMGRDGKSYGLRANGTVVNFEGFLKVYNEARDNRVLTIEKGKEDRAEAEDDDDRRLPPLAAGDTVTDKQIEAEQHFTQPPARYSEASLVKRLEELGIGRPSTFASTMATLQDREYVRIEKKRLIPEDKGRMVTAFLVAFFKRYVEYAYTADLEEQLDLISDDKLDWREMLRKFWKEFRGSIDETKELRITDVLNALNDSLGPHLFPDKGDGCDPRLCPKCGKNQLSLKPSPRSGAFIGCQGYPECSYSRPLSATGEAGEAAALDGKVLGTDPESGLDVTLKNGRFGAYVQLGEAASKEDKPKRSSLPKGWEAASLDLERALLLLSLPRTVGMHPETNTPITAALGRFGPYIKHDNTYCNVADIDEVFSVGINRAVTLLAEKRAGKGGFKRGQAARVVLLDLGEHPDEGGKIEILEGKYGAYITHNGVNATVPKARDPKTVTVTEAMSLLTERIANGGGKAKKGRFAKKAPAKAKAADGDAKPAAKKASAKKAAAKKAPAKKATATKAATKTVAASQGDEPPPWEPEDGM